MGFVHKFRFSGSASLLRVKHNICLYMCIFLQVREQRGALPAVRTPRYHTARDATSRYHDSPRGHIPRNHDSPRDATSRYRDNPRDATSRYHDNPREHTARDQPPARDTASSILHEKREPVPRPAVKKSIDNSRSGE